MLRNRFSAFAWQSRLTRNHPTRLTFLRNTSTLSGYPRYSYRHGTRFLLGVGVVSATGFLLYPHTVYADTDARWVRKQLEGPPLSLSPGLRGVACAQSITNGEDKITLDYFPFSETLGYLFIGIFDGHNGPEMAFQLSSLLSEAVVGALADLYSEHAKKSSTMDMSSGIYLRNPGTLPNPIPPDEEIDDAIRKMFRAFDDTLVHDSAKRLLGLDDTSYAALQACNSLDAAKDLITSFQIKRPRMADVSSLNAAYSGSCALLGLFNTDDRSLRVALTGDSRAVLGRRILLDGGGYKYEVHHLTADQNASNPDEAARLTALHPDEPELLKNGRTVGWGPSRAFGDGSMKWSRAVQTALHDEAWGDRLRDACQTPPYFTAEPVLTTMKDIRRGDFAVFASDGLWDCLTSEEVVGLVGQWLEEKGMSENVIDRDGRPFIIRVPLPSDSTQVPIEPSSMGITQRTDSKMYLPAELPVIYPPSYKDNTMMYKWWRAEKKFMCEDEFVAVHLMRNALGAANHELGGALLDMRMPRARKFRDDISICVLFFD